MREEWYLKFFVEIKHFLFQREKSYNMSGRDSYAVLPSRMLRQFPHHQVR